ncbi:uncharacterized protein LOC143634097 [Bidens hawaiensis]|uniref:uncharacterized protein LOC143634097 n=1 Tax=Bidens hawaiensis TaxID=980011 RepID=UPI00404A2198
MINTKGFKSDNGFRTGYLQHLESSLKESLPRTDLLARPHIESRVKTMERDWAVVHEMLNTSGFGYDKEHNCVTAEAPMWEAYVEKHPTADKWKRKILPHYEEMCVIFGNDRAQGNRAKSVAEMEEEANREELEDQRDDEFDEFSHNEGTNASVQVEEISSGRGKKRKRASQANSLFQNFNDAVVLFGDRLKETSTELSEGIKYELEKEKKTTMITSEIKKMTSLSQLEKFKAIEEIKSDYNRVSTFWDLGEEEREDWVRFLLSK